MGKLSGKQQEYAEAKPSQKISVDRRVRNAIEKLQGTEGISLRDLKKYLRDERNMDVVALSDDIKQVLKAGIDKGVLIREDGNYKVRAAARRIRSRSKGGRSRSRKRSKGRSRSRRRTSAGRPRRRRRKGAPQDEA